MRDISLSSVAFCGGKFLKVLVTGHTGFLGKNLCDVLLHEYGDGLEMEGFNSSNNLEDLRELVRGCDFIYHFAAVHRPKEDSEFGRVNVGILKEICRELENASSKCSILYTSSIQSEDDTSYGRSKRESEKLLIKHSMKTGNRIYIYRLTNLFGGGGRPNSHSVVATFCYNFSRMLPIRIDDPEHEIRLCYVDDVVRLFAGHLRENGGGVMQ